MIPIYITDVTWFTAINSDVMSFKKFHEPKFWPNPCNSHVMSHCLCLFHMCMEVLCQGFWVEALRGSTSWSLSLKRCRKLSVCKSLRASNLAQFSVFSSGTCHKRRSDGDRPEFGHPHESSQVLEGSGQKHQLLLVQFLPISISRGILPLNGLVLVTVDHPSKLRHGSQRFLWCCYSSRGRKNFEVDLGEISWNNVKT